jgi:hypothetical protein
MVDTSWLFDVDLLIDRQLYQTGSDRSRQTERLELVMSKRHSSGRRTRTKGNLAIDFCFTIG